MTNAQTRYSVQAAPGPPENVKGSWDQTKTVFHDDAALVKSETMNSTEDFLSKMYTFIYITPIYP